MTGCSADGPDYPGGAEPVVDDDERTEVLRPGDPVRFVATEFSFTPAELSAEQGSYTGTLVNEGAVAHNITFATGESFDVPPGQTVPIDFVVPDGGVTFICAVPGHEDAGMSGAVLVGEPA